MALTINNTEVPKVERLLGQSPYLPKIGDYCMENP
jgi:hypothetical protein